MLLDVLTFGHRQHRFSGKLEEACADKILPTALCPFVFGLSIILPALSEVPQVQPQVMLPRFRDHKLSNRRAGLHNGRIPRLHPARRLQKLERSESQMGCVMRPET